ncbi:EAL domain-containing protein [Effusibacillus consociatus]|uniref:EAL domain-containing protein n=1 Tax=Effusibacillus consociatus TaxID=1117041 RepID=A0ABV9Q0R5_9BACL
MKTWNTVYHEKLNLEEYLKKNGIGDHPALLVQVFTGGRDEDFIAELRKRIHDFLPSAVMIGASSTGEIADGVITSNQTILSFTQFEKTDLVTTAIPHDREPDSFRTGQEIARCLVSHRTKVMILFADGWYTNGEELIKGVESVNPHVVVAGGIAAVKDLRSPNLIFTEREILNRGVVGVALNSDDLIVNTKCNFDWTNIGQFMTITKAEKNRVYEIDDRPAIEAFRKYLGEEVGLNRSKHGAMFPLVVNRNGNLVARTCLLSHEDGSLTFSGNLKRGERVQFAYGNTELLVKSSIRTTQELQEIPTEAIFVYSCISRRTLMMELMGREIIPFQKKAPTAGFFTFGEFYRYEQNNEFLNHAMTALILSESAETRKFDPVQTELGNKTEVLSYLRAVSHLINVTTTELQKTNEALLEKEERYRRLVESCPVSIAVYHDDKIVLANRAAAALIGVKEPQELIGRSIFEFIHPEDRETVKNRIMSRFRKESIEQVNVDRLIRLDGRVIDVETVTNAFQLDDKPGAQIFIHDITERNRYEEQIKFHAYYDSLTGLPNRLQFLKDLSHALSQAQQNGNLLAVLFLDLDRFKNINDTLGHSIGDQLLSAVADRLKGCAGETAFVARLAGDEFTVLLPKMDHVQDAVSVAECIIDSFANPFTIQGYELFLTTSIGISVYPNDSDHIEALIKNADTAMYRAKEQGKNNYQMFTPEMKVMAFHRLILENSMRKALERNEFSLVYQPIVNSNNLQITGVEALLRWRHPEMGDVSPADFIPLAEETGMIVPIGEWVLRTASAQNKAWQDAGYPPIRMSVNLSARQFLQPNVNRNLVKTVKEALETTGLEAKWLVLEMTESIMQNYDNTIETLRQLQEIGVRISIDDFGTGYSSLSYLKRLPIDALKIDQSFVRDLTTDPDHAAIARAIIAMAHSLKLKVTAEGVETEGQAHYLRDLKCDKMQGYLFSKPLTASEFESLLRAGKPYMLASGSPGFVV